VNRRAFGRVIKQIWFVLFMTPWKAAAQGCCVNYHVDCSLAGYSNCDSTHGFFAADEPVPDRPILVSITSVPAFGALLAVLAALT
jgi:hypothetical protein